MKTLPLLLLLLCAPLAAQITITIDDGDARTKNIAITIPAEAVPALDARRFDFTDPESPTGEPLAATPSELIRLWIERHLEDTFERHVPPSVQAAEDAVKDAQENARNARRNVATTERKSR